jgi:zinc/manganese transport system permease protein
VAGVLLVFTYLIIPALAGIAVGGPVARWLWVGWGFGTAVSVTGLLASAVLDLPTGAAVACAFGVAILAWFGTTRLQKRSVT